MVWHKSTVIVLKCFIGGTTVGIYVPSTELQSHFCNRKTIELTLWISLKLRHSISLSKVNDFVWLYLAMNF